MFDEFENYEKYLDCFAGGLNDKLTFAVVVDKLDNVWMSDLLEKTHFIVKDLLESGQGNALNVVSFYYFYRQKLTTCLVLSKFNPKNKHNRSGLVLKQISQKWNSKHNFNKSREAFKRGSLYIQMQGFSNFMRFLVEEFDVISKR